MRKKKWKTHTHSQPHTLNVCCVWTQILILVKNFRLRKYIKIQNLFSFVSNLIKIKTFLPYTNYWNEVLPCDVEKIENIFLHVILINQNRVHCKRTKSTFIFLYFNSRWAEPPRYGAIINGGSFIEEILQQKYIIFTIYRRSQHHFLYTFILIYLLYIPISILSLIF